MEEKTTSSSAQILVIEDETEIRELISLLLLRLGHRVQQCGSVPEAVMKLQQTQFDLVVLDWMLPQTSGVDFLKNYESLGLAKPPVLMVTAKSAPEDIVEGLENGADDYITKPFELAVFSARVKALLRRSENVRSKTNRPGELILGDLAINTLTYQVTCGQELLHLTPSEFKILVQMTQNRGRVMTREFLIGVVQGEGISVTGRTIDTHVFGLRKKLGPCADWIETIRGVGYRVKA